MPEVSTGPARHSVLLGGLGGDSHSVGLNILRHALHARGYQVVFIGTQNTIETFWEIAPYCNAVMISCMDGHARAYLKRFPELRARHSDDHQPLWYLGGNPMVEEMIGGDRYFIEMGFRRCYLKFIEIDLAMDNLARDMAAETARPVPPSVVDAFFHQHTAPLLAVSDSRLSDEDMTEQRQQVLQQWRTGNEARNMEDNAAFLKSVPNWTAYQAEVADGKRSMLIQPRSGVPGVAEQIKLFEAFKQAGAPVLSYQVDSHTRNNNHVLAEEAIKESRLLKYSTLNGFPVVNHGPTALRRVIRTTKVPLQTRHSTRDPRLLAEISYAGGVTAYEGGPLCYNLPYYKNYPVAESILRWRYVDRLTGEYYDKYGIVLDREYFGTLTATLIPPSLAISTGIIESILAAQQGVKAVSIGWAEQGNRVQDIAAIRSIRPLATEILANFGHKDVRVSSIYHQYMAAFPSLQTQAEQLIRASGTTAALSGATRVLTKTPVEAFKIPSVADNISGLQLTRRGILDAEEDGLVHQIDEPAVEQEMAIIRAEVMAIIDAVVGLGRDNFAQGVVEAVRTGVIDIPFAPSVFNRGKAVTARDCDQAVRYLDFGNLPFSREIRQFHEEKIRDRRRRDAIGEQETYKLIERDVLVVALGQYEHWPLKS